MANTNVWETISFDQIKAGDKIRTVTVEPDGTKRHLQGTVRKRSTMWRAWYSEDGNTLVDADSKYLVSIQRKNANAFKMPKRLAAVIEGTRISTGETTRFVLADPEDSDKWHDVANQSWYNDEELKSKYRNLKVLSKGVKDA